MEHKDLRGDLSSMLKNIKIQWDKERETAVHQQVMNEIDQINHTSPFIRKIAILAVNLTFLLIVAASVHVFLLKEDHKLNSVDHESPDTKPAQQNQVKDDWDKTVLLNQETNFKDEIVLRLPQALYGRKSETFIQTGRIITARTSYGQNENEILVYQSPNTIEFDQFEETIKNEAGEGDQLIKFEIQGNQSFLVENEHTIRSYIYTKEYQFVLIAFNIGQNEMMDIAKSIDLSGIQ